MSIRETAIAKLQQLPEPLLQQVSDFIDFLTHRQQPDSTNDYIQSNISAAWTHWFESVDRLETETSKSLSVYQQLLLAKYRQKGLNLEL